VKHAWRKALDPFTPGKYSELFTTIASTARHVISSKPANLAEVIKWSWVNVDLWGPKTVNNKNGIDYKIHVLTMMDPVTGWFEVAAVQDSSTAFEVQRLLDSY
jgi:hypothetical protein